MPTAVKIATRNQDHHFIMRSFERKKVLWDHTCRVQGKSKDGAPRQSLESVVGARYPIEAVSVRNSAFASACGTKVAKSNVAEEVRKLGELVGFQNFGSEKRETKG